MNSPSRIVVTAGLLLCLWLLRGACRLRGLPPPPWRLPVAAMAIQLIGDPLASQIPATAPRALMRMLDGLVGSYAAVVLVSWALLQLPAALGLGKGMPQILRDLLGLTVGGLLTVVTLQQAGMNPVGLVTTSAVLTAVIGLAAQETLKDLFGGVSMQIGAAYQVGDWVDLGDHSGWVESITLMNTRLSSLDGAEIIVPNSQAAATAARRYRADQPMADRFVIGLDYSHPPAQARHLILQVLNDHPAVLGEPAPEVWISRYGESSVEYELLAFQNMAGEAVRLRRRGELLEQLWYALQREDYSIPFPVLELRRQPPQRIKSEEMNWKQAGFRAEQLITNPLFSELSREELATLASLTRCLRFGPGETVMREGEAGDCLYQVLEGLVEVTKRSSPSERGVEVATLSKGAVFGEMTVFTGEPRSATVRSAGECVLLEVEQRDLVPLIEANPRLLERLGELVSKRQTELQKLSSITEQTRRHELIRTMKALFNRLRSESN